VAIRNLRALILAGERYRQVLSEHLGLGVTETQAISYLTIHGDRGQNDLASDLGLSSGASTALVDRLERQGIAERYPHASDRRRTWVRLTDNGRSVVQESRQMLSTALEDIPTTQFDQVAEILRTIAEGLTEQSEKMARQPKRDLSR
jgi:DNA-binding MarR family transcriptional regulator